MIAATDSPPLTRPRSKWRERLVLLLILASGSALSLLAGNNVHTTEALRLKEQITAANNAVVSAFKLEVTRTTEAIRSAGLMLEASPQLSREQFNRYMQKMLADQLSVNLMEWQPIVPANQLPTFEAAARTAGLTNFRVLEPEGKGWKLVSGRNEYVPVLFAWPETYRTAGLDMSFRSERMASKLQSRAIAQPVASGTFAFMKDGMVNSGVTAIAISTAVFAIDNATKNFLTAEAARPVSLNNAYLGHTARGYLAAVVDLPTLFLQATHVADAAKFDLLVFASTAADTAPIYTWLGDDSDLQQMTRGLRQATTDDQSTIVDFAHQSWTLVLHPRPAFYAGRRQKLSATPDLSGTVLPLCLIPNSALKSAPPFKSVMPKASACAGLPA